MNHHRVIAFTRPVPYVLLLQTLLGITLALAATAVLAAQKTLDRTFDVSAGGVLTVNADGADVTVTGNDANKVVVHIDVRGSDSDLEDLNLSAEPSSEGIQVEARHPNRKGWINWNSSHYDAHIDVRVPHSYRVDAKTSGGDVRIQDVSGPSIMRTSGGDVTAKNVKGAFEGHTSGGDVRIESMEGPVTVHTSGGNVLVSQVKGDVDANTSGGDVRVVAVDGKIKAGTSGGTVRCELTGANHGITATTSGGSVWLTLPKDITGTVDAQASGGHIDSDFPISTTRWSEHRLSGQINGGGNEIYVRTSGGNITLSSAR
jgi:DUF4097 and DUF4098 domain-containing protein YvlB